MYFKILVLALAWPFLMEAINATQINTNVDEQELVEMGNEDELIEEDEKANDETKRSLIGGKKKESFGEVSLELARLHLLEEAAKKRKGITSLQNEVNKNSPDKCTKIKKVGEPIVHHHSGIAQGTWMRDPLGLLGAETIWYMNGYHRNKLLKFDSMEHFKGGEVSQTYTLPYKFDGTGSVVYGRYLYFNRENTRNIVQYDLVTKKIIREKYPYTTSIVPRKYYYNWGGYTTFDLSVDESGLWVMYSYSSYSGKLCATQLDPLTLNSLHTYCGVSSTSMTSIGNAFVACGVVYSINSYNARKTTINYAYDTVTKTATNPRLAFTNNFGYNSMVTYNPREKVLYAWDRNRQITYPLEFEEPEDETA